MLKGSYFPGDNDIVLLGDNFLFDYYLHYDPPGKRIGLFGPNKKAPDASLLGYGGLNMLLAAIGLLYFLF